MTDLIQRIEAAKEPSVELFEEAFVAIHGPKPPRVHGGSQEWLDWLHLHNPFYAMLKAQAWTSAAEMLVPDGWFIYGIGEKVKSIIYKGDLHEHLGFWAEVQHRQGGRLKKASAAHPSLALLAAILKANGYE